MPNSTERKIGHGTKMIDTSLAGIQSREDSAKRNPGILYVVCDEKLRRY